ncbi:MAG TPA: hypothetical protein PLY88_09050 [Candidatus Omnitrophota bacterium]|nr:hypothetical protein [Candidatus Omnitrophota bacterium]
MSEAKKDDVFGFGGTIQETQKKLQDLGKEQSAFFTDLMEKNMKFQKDQFDLLSKIVQNQVDHNNKIIQDYVKIASNGAKTTVSK